MHMTITRCLFPTSFVVDLGSHPPSICLPDAITLPLTVVCTRPCGSSCLFFSCSSPTNTGLISLCKSWPHTASVAHWHRSACSESICVVSGVIFKVQEVKVTLSHRLDLTAFPFDSHKLCLTMLSSTNPSMDVAIRLLSSESAWSVDPWIEGWDVTTTTHTIGTTLSLKAKEFKICSHARSLIL